MPLPLALSPASLPVIRIQALSRGSQLCKLPVSSWWETPSISLARGSATCPADPWAPRAEPLEWLV